MAEKPREASTKSVEVIDLGDNIYKIVPKGKYILNLQDSKDLMAMVNKINPNNETKGYVVDFNNLTFISKDARDNLQSHEELLCETACVAIYTHTVIGRLLGTFFLGINRPENIPVKLFTTLDKSLEWVKTQMADVNARKEL